ncbi:hypothetical protein ACJMK2_022947 [Sinanodonta woodiana]|uniref:Uncharacterized protein n=1 Tax=Sinanodonta woodiana TaxID=1069815 RepID=A0ABD3TLK1_SINWO
MGFSDTTCLCKLVLILLSLCFVIDLIGFAIPYWYVFDHFGIKINGGLWNQCDESSGFRNCVRTDERLPDSILRWFRAVQAFSTLSWVYFLAALVLVMVFVFSIPGRRVMYLAAIILIFAGAVCALISFTVYAMKFTIGLNQYSAAFAMTISASILGFLSGCISVLDYLGVGRCEKVIQNKDVYYDFDFY